MKDNSTGTLLVLRPVGTVLALALLSWGCAGDDDAGMFAGCGDGLFDSGEECDDGNTTDCDGCSATCQIERGPVCCGDGIVQPPETCDDGNTVPGDGCSDTCTIEKGSEEFTGVFVGTVTVTHQGEPAVSSTITLTLSVNSPLTGGYFITDVVGTNGEIFGNASGNSATFTAAVESLICPNGTMSGSMILVDGNITLIASGNDCSGNFTFAVSEAVPTPEDCGDNADNDNDGAVDCADPDCFRVPACAPA